MILTTNDSSFLESEASREHVIISQIRAVETGRWVVAMYRFVPRVGALRSNQLSGALASVKFFALYKSSNNAFFSMIAGPADAVMSLHWECAELKARCMKVK
jgi:hypothetical protein